MFFCVDLDVDECARSCNEEGQQYFDTAGSYNCSCKKGWTLIGSHCVDLNECNNFQSNAKCMNMDGMICEDMNECEMNNLSFASNLHQSGLHVSIRLEWTRILLQRH